MEACVAAGGKPSKSEITTDPTAAPDLSVDKEDYALARRDWAVAVGTVVVMVGLVALGWYRRWKARRRLRGLEAEAKRRWQQQRRE